MEEKEEYYSTNNIASLIKALAIVSAIAGFIASSILGAEANNTIISIVGSIGSILSALLLYAIGELIEIMHDIRTNTEHLRDYLESEKR